jgi:hypothetical protein
MLCANAHGIAESKDPYSILCSGRQSIAVKSKPQMFD